MPRLGVLPKLYISIENTVTIHQKPSSPQSRAQSRANSEFNGNFTDDATDAMAPAMVEIRIGAADGEIKRPMTEEAWVAGKKQGRRVAGKKGSGGEASHAMGLKEDSGFNQIILLLSM
ncbi:unnamed protein product [Linum trigynum]|uniref:Uncharacterized protein n=1 Tax=Linum trigynum TaxID=586398 RepID=A0AAV2CME1_9ROSI